MCDSHQYKL